MIEFADFLKVDMRVGEIISARLNEKALKPAYVLDIDFGAELGIKQSSAQICANYTASELIGRQVIAVVNFPPKRVAGIRSEVWFWRQFALNKAPFCFSLNAMYGKGKEFCNRF